MGSEARTMKALCHMTAGKTLRVHPPRGCKLRWLYGSGR